MRIIGEHRVDRKGEMKVEKNARVAFQGERGAFSEEAAVKLLGEDIVLVPRRTFEAAFSAIDDAAADYILAPIENSLAGSVHRSFDLLVDSRLNILAEVIIPIVHNLIAAPGGRVRRSGGCRIASRSAGAVRAVFQRASAAEADRHRRHRRQRARSGSGRRSDSCGNCGAPRGGNLRRRDSCESISRTIAKTTRASCSSRLHQRSRKTADKLSLVFQLDHRPRALYYALEPFARRNVNLMKIESRPVHGRPWQYRFYLDLQASRRDPEVAAALRRTGKAGRRVANSRVVRIRAAIGKRANLSHLRGPENDFQHVGRRN